jgi:hypothetical protein
VRHFEQPGVENALIFDALGNQEQTLLGKAGRAQDGEFHQRRKNGYRQSKEMRSSKLLVHGYGWKILQRAVRNDAKNAGHRM